MFHFPAIWILGCDSSDYENYEFMGFTLLCDRRLATAYRPLLTDFLLVLLIDLEERGNTFLRDVNGLLPNYYALQHRSSYSF
jgi:hypothetical protein